MVQNDWRCKVGTWLNKHCKIFCKLECLIQRLINMEKNQKQTKIPWNAKGTVCLRDFRGRIQVG